MQENKYFASQYIVGSFNLIFQHKSLTFLFQLSLTETVLYKIILHITRFNSYVILKTNVMHISNKMRRGGKKKSTEFFCSMQKILQHLRF